MKTIKVLNLSTHNEDCGIGKYQESFVEAINKHNNFSSVFYPTSPNILRKLRGGELEEELGKFKQYLREYDILHIQHEFGFFSNDGEGIRVFMDIAKQLGKKIVITIHTAPSLVYKPVSMGGYGLRSQVGYLKRKLNNKTILKKRLLPLGGADRIITLNSNTTKELVGIVGFSRDKIHQTVIPVERNNIEEFDLSLLRRSMKAKDGDTILATVGFLSDKKGSKAAVKSLRFMPENHKLAILGGVNPSGGNTMVYDDLCDTILEYGLEKRVYISGYIDDDRQLDRLVAGADIALYPYDPEYYKLASSAAINKAINNHVPVIAYPTQSFIELEKKFPGSIYITNSANYNEISRAVGLVDRKSQLLEADKLSECFSMDEVVGSLLDLYEEVLS